MDPGQDKHQHGDQSEAHKVVLPADESPVIEGHPDSVSEDKGEESRWTSPPVSVNNTTSSSENEVGNNNTSSSSGSGSSSSSCSCTSSSSCSCTSSSSCSCTSSSSEDEVGNDCTTSSSLTVESQEGVSPLISLESTHGRNKREEPILRPLDSIHIGTCQPYQVGLEEDAGHVTSVTGRNRKRTKGRDSEEEAPAKKTRHSVDEEDPVLSSPVKTGMTSCSKIIMAYDDLVWSSPVISPSDEDPFLSSTVLSPSPLDSILEDPILPPSIFCASPISFEHHILLFSAMSPPQRLGLEEEAGHVTSATCRKRTKVSDAEEEPPVKKTRHSVAEEDPVPSSPVLTPSCGMAQEDPVWLSAVLTPSQYLAHEDPVWLSPDISPSQYLAHEDPVWLSPDISPTQYILHEDPFLMSTVLRPSPLDPIFEDPILLTCVFSLSPTLPFDDPILSFPVLGPSPSAHGKDSSLSSSDDCILVESSSSSSDDCILMECEEDIEEEPIQSTSGIGPDRIRERESFRQPWFRPFYNLSSDSD